MNIKPAKPVPEPRFIGLMPKSTGLDFVLWLHRKKSNELIFIEATPDTEYETKERALILLEPEYIVNAPNMPKQDLDSLDRFIARNINLIEDYWFGRITAGEDVVARLLENEDGSAIK